jgi:hypothetical protein
MLALTVRLESQKHLVYIRPLNDELTDSRMTTSSEEVRERGREQNRGKDNAIAALTIHCMGHEKQIKFVTMVKTILEKHQLAPQVGPICTTIGNMHDNLISG